MVPYFRKLSNGIPFFGFPMMASVSYSLEREVFVEEYP